MGLHILYLLCSVCSVLATFNVSQSLSSHMVLQRAPASAKLWGQAIPGTSVRISFSGISLSTVAGADSVWIQTLPPQPSSSQGVSILLNASTGESKVLEDVLFGDVYVCGGQSNMAYEMAGFINSTAILEYPNIRLLSVGGAFSTQTPQIDYPHVSLPWTSAANSSGFPSIIGFSMVCFFFGKGLTDGLGADAPPIGLISSNVGGTRIGFWASQEALAPCSCTQCEQPSSGYYNGMIYPLKNMAITGVLWYQGQYKKRPSFHHLTLPWLLWLWPTHFGPKPALARVIGSFAKGPLGPRSSISLSSCLALYINTHTHPLNTHARGR